MGPASDIHDVSLLESCSNDSNDTRTKVDFVIGVSCDYVAGRIGVLANNWNWPVIFPAVRCGENMPEATSAYGQFFATIFQFTRLLKITWNTFSGKYYCIFDLFNMHLVGFQLRATEREWKSELNRQRCCDSPETQPVHDADKQQYTSACRDVHVPWGDIQEWKKAGQPEWCMCGKANALLRKLYRSVVVKRQLSKIVKLTAMVILTYGHESWLMAERALSQPQTAEMGFFRRVHGVTLRASAQQLWNS